MAAPHLLVFGPGFSARPFMARAKDAGWQVTASARSPEKAAALEAEGYDILDLHSPWPEAKMAHVSHILTSVAPPRDGSSIDPILERFGSDIARLNQIQWVGYLSATNVYGDHQGAWVDEETPATPGLPRGARRVKAEAAWIKLADSLGAAAHVFRLAGIYGPGRNLVKSLRAGTARRVFKEGQIFSRIHIADICEALWRAANRPGLGHQIFNLADDAPLPPHEAVERAAQALAMAPPAMLDYASADMSPMARSFYSESKRVSNKKVKQMLGMRFTYPTLESALPDLIEFETEDT